MDGAQGQNMSSDLLDHLARRQRMPCTCILSSFNQSRFDDSHALHFHDNIAALRFVDQCCLCIQTNIHKVTNIWHGIWHARRLHVNHCAMHRYVRYNPAVSHLICQQRIYDDTFLIWLHFKSVQCTHVCHHVVLSFTSRH